ncbi:unnamed protein product, partial [Nesidiocoris tenuis]
MLCSSGGAGEEGAVVGVACSSGEGGVPGAGADAWWALGAAAPQVLSCSSSISEVVPVPGTPGLTGTDWREDMAFTAFELDPLPPLFSPPPLQPYRYVLNLIFVTAVKPALEKGIVNPANHPHPLDRICAEYAEKPTLAPRPSKLTCGPIVVKNLTVFFEKIWKFWNRHIICLTVDGELLLMCQKTLTFLTIITNEEVIDFTLTATSVGESLDRAVTFSIVYYTKSLHINMFDLQRKNGRSLDHCTLKTIVSSDAWPGQECRFCHQIGDDDGDDAVDDDRDSEHRTQLGRPDSLA